MQITYHLKLCIRLKGTNLGTPLSRYDKFKVGLRGGLLVF